MKKFVINLSLCSSSPTAWLCLTISYLISLGTGGEWGRRGGAGIYSLGAARGGDGRENFTVGARMGERIL